MSSRNIFIIILILGFLPNLIFAATINSITPNRGWASEIVIINGENFGDNKKSVDSGFRYVRVGGFINTKILSWSNSAVKISTPTLQEATSDTTRLNPFWLLAKIPDKASLGLLSFVTKLFDATVSPVSANIDNTIAITVVTPPFRESNQGFFTYAAQSPLMAVAGDFNNLLSITYDSFGEDIVGLLTNPKELVKTIGRETVRGIQEVPLFVRDLFAGQDPSQPSPKDGDVSDQNTTPPQQTINQTATQEKQPAQEQPLDTEVLTTQPPTQNSKVPAPTTGQTQPPTQQPPVASEQKISSSILVVDQFNEPVEGARVWIEDERGKTYPSGGYVGYWNTDRVGRLHFSYNETGQIPDGKFNIHIEKEGYSPTKENMDISSSPAVVVISPSKFVLNKLPIVAGILLDASGEPALNRSYMNAPDSPFGYTPYITITSNDGKVINEIHCSIMGCGGRANPKTGRFESKPLPPGHYLLKVWIPGGYQKSDVVMVTKELDISYNQKEVWLGQITINGIPF